VRRAAERDHALSAGLPAAAVVGGVLLVGRLFKKK